MSSHELEHLKSCIEKCKERETNRHRESDSSRERTGDQVLKCAAACII